MDNADVGFIGLFGDLQEKNIQKVGPNELKYLCLIRYKCRLYKLILKCDIKHHAYVERV